MATTTFDPAAIRRDFPIFERVVNGKPLVYLDSAATSQKPQVVIDAIEDYYRSYNANIHRGVYTIAEEATAAYEASRRKVARFIGAADTAEVVFTRNTTEAINLLAYTWGRKNTGPGDDIVLTEMEHHSNLVPWILLSEQTGVTLKHIPFDDHGVLDMDAARRMIGPRTKLVSVVHASNVLGTINPVAELAALAHEQGALMLVDGAQSVPHFPTNIAELGCDFLAFSAHKMVGPTGVGALWARRELLESMPPFLGGGEMIAQVFLDHATYNELPWKYEAGTQNIADAIAWGTAIDYLEGIGMSAIREHDIELTEYALERLSEEPDVTLYGPLDARARGGVVAFNVGDVHSHDVAAVLDADAIAIRVGHHCCQPIMRHLDIPGTARASFYLYNTREDVDKLVDGLARVRELFGNGSA
jgi:cysteine desulfurase / selenocysteine lyase